MYEFDVEQVSWYLRARDTVFSFIDFRSSSENRAPYRLGRNTLTYTCEDSFKVNNITSPYLVWTFSARSIGYELSVFRDVILIVWHAEVILNFIDRSICKRFKEPC